MRVAQTAATVAHEVSVDSRFVPRSSLACLGRGAEAQAETCSRARLTSCAGPRSQLCSGSVPACAELAHSVAEHRSGRLTTCASRASARTVAHAAATARGTAALWLRQRLATPAGSGLRPTVAAASRSLNSLLLPRSSASASCVCQLCGR